MLSLITILNSSILYHITVVAETMDGETRIYGMPHRFGETMWQLSFPIPCEDSAKKLSSLGAEAMKEEAIRRCSGWHEPIPSLLMVRTPCFPMLHKQY